MTLLCTTRDRRYGSSNQRARNRPTVLAVAQLCYIEHMNLSAPIEGLIPGLRGRVLTALVRAATPLSLRELSRRAGSAGSPSTVKGVVQELIDEGIAKTSLVSRGSHFFELNREHLLAVQLSEIDHAKDATLDVIRDEIAEWERDPRGVVLFGSVARAKDKVGSDIDLCIVWKADPEPDDAWTLTRNHLSHRVYAMTGNPLSIIEFSATEWEKALRNREPLLDSIRADGVSVAGTSVHTLTHPMRKLSK